MDRLICLVFVVLLALPLAGVLARVPRLGGALTLASVALMLAVTATDPQKPWSAPALALDLVTPGPATPREHDGSRLDRFDFTPRVSSNTLGAYELKPHQFFERGSVEADFNAFNLGEAVAPRSVFSLLPLVLLLVLAVPLLLRGARARDAVERGAGA